MLQYSSANEHQHPIHFRSFDATNMKVPAVCLFLITHFLPSQSVETAAAGIYWQDLSVETSSNVTLLHAFSGFIATGELCGIIGPSGSGKSSLLRTLGGRRFGDLKSSGKFWWNDDASSRSSSRLLSPSLVAFLHQQDVFFGMLTAKETLQLASFLEFPDLKRTERDAIVQKSLDSLGLTLVQDRKIGDRLMSDAKGGGLSGGEQRRLSLALEMLGNPRLFLADEATTGLDSTQANKVVRLISDLAKERNIPALLSLHQPRASIWRMLDRFILLGPSGRVCYVGKRSDAMSYFQRLGYECPEETNPAEFFIDLVSVDTEDAEQGRIDEMRIDELMLAFRNFSQTKLTRYNPVIDSASSLSTPTSRAPILRRFASLLKRSWRQNIRNTHYNLLRLGASVGNALLFGQIFASVKRGVPLIKSIADRTALLSFGVINMSMMALMKTIHLFSRERPVVGREQEREQYSSLEYLLSKAFAEIPLDTFFGVVFTTTLKLATGLRISWKDLTAAFSLMTVAGASLGFAVGSWTDSADSAMAVGVPLMVIFMVVGIINPSGVDSTNGPPLLVKLLQQVSPIKWAIEALCVAEYKGMELREGHSRWGRIRDLPKMGAFSLVQNGSQILEALGLEKSTYTSTMRHLAIISGANLFLSWLGLEMHFTKLKRSNHTRKGKTLKKAKPRQGEMKVSAPIVKRL